MNPLLKYTITIVFIETFVLSILPFLTKNISTLIRYPLYAIIFGIIITVSLINFSKRNRKTLTVLQVIGYVTLIYIISGFFNRIVVSILKDKDLIPGLQKLEYQLPVNLILASIIALIVAGIYSKNKKIKSIKNTNPEIKKTT